MKQAKTPDENLPLGRFGQRFWPLFLFGLLGVAALPLLIIPMLRNTQLPVEVPELPLAMMVALAMINPVLLLALATALGAWLAPRLGLRSLLVEWRVHGTPMLPGLRAVAPLAIGLGLGFALLTVLLDALVQPLLSPQWHEGSAEAFRPGTLGHLIAGLLYGGITEEILLRWGMLSLLAWALWRIVQRRREKPTPAIFWTAIILAALLFGIGHLPAVGAIAPLDVPLVLRTIGLNALGGLIFGWLFWRYHLEAAMLAHAAAHIGFFVMGPLG